MNIVLVFKDNKFNRFAEIRKQKKQNKKMADLEKELLESKGEESKQTKERFFTDATKIVFTIYFRVLKSFPKSSLMGKFLKNRIINFIVFYAL